MSFNVRDGGIFYWDTSADTLGTDRGTAISSLSGAQTSTPTVAKQVMLSDRDRHVICFGCDDVDNNDVSTGVLDPLLITGAIFLILEFLCLKKRG